MVQATRAQTLAYALADSPVGQLAWIVERLKDWIDSSDAPEDAVDRDAMPPTSWFTGSTAPQDPPLATTKPEHDATMRTPIGRIAELTNDIVQ